MRADAARVRAVIALLLIGSCVAYVGYEYRNARVRAAGEEVAERIRRQEEIERIRRKAIETQPEVYVPPAPIIANVF
ncbi:MAG: hypothetical protein ABI579_08515 [Candidatus Sumerlaeota bacterium]